MLIEFCPYLPSCVWIAAYKAKRKKWSKKFKDIISNTDLYPCFASQKLNVQTLPALKTCELTTVKRKRKKETKAKKKKKKKKKKGHDKKKQKQLQKLKDYIKEIFRQQFAIQTLSLLVSLPAEIIRKQTENSIDRNLRTIQKKLERFFLSGNVMWAWLEYTWHLFPQKDLSVLWISKTVLRKSKTSSSVTNHAST